MSANGVYLERDKAEMTISLSANGVYLERDKAGMTISSSANGVYLEILLSTICGLIYFSPLDIRPHLSDEMSEALR